MNDAKNYSEMLSCLSLKHTVMGKWFVRVKPDYFVYVDSLQLISLTYWQCYIKSDEVPRTISEI